MSCCVTLLLFEMDVSQQNNDSLDSVLLYYEFCVPAHVNGLISVQTRECFKKRKVKDVVSISCTASQQFYRDAYYEAF